MVITKYAVIDAPLQDRTRGGGGALDLSALSYAFQDDLACTIYDSEDEAVDAISESGFTSKTYIVPLTIEVSNIHQVKLQLETVFD